MKTKTWALALAIALLAALPARADWFVKSISLGHSSSRSCINPVTNRVYTGFGERLVNRIDGNACTALPGIPVKGAVNEIVCDPASNKVYVSYSDSAYVTVIQDANPPVVTHIPVATRVDPMVVCPVVHRLFGSGWGDSLVVIDTGTNAVSYIDMGYRGGYLAINPNTVNIYVTSWSSNKVIVVNGGGLSVTTTINVGNCPIAVAVNPVTNKIYAANQGSNNVSIINGATNAVTATVSAGDTPWSVAVNPVTNKAYVSNENSNYLTVVDGATNTSSQIPIGSSQTALCVNPSTNKIYGAIGDPGIVSIIDGVTGSVDTMFFSGYPCTIVANPVTNKVFVGCNAGQVLVLDGSADSCTAVAAGTGPNDVAVNPWNNRIYTSNDDGTVSVLNGVTNAVTNVTVGGSPRSVAVNPVTGRIYIANSGDGTVSVISSTTVTKTITVGSQPYNLAVNPVTDKIYAANYGSGTVSVIDGSGDTVCGTRTVGTQPRWIAVNPATNRVFVANYGSGTVSVLDESNGTVAATVPVANNPASVAVNPVTNKIYVACYGGNCVKVIDGNTYAVLATLTNGTGAWSVAVNPVLNRIYVTNLASNDVTVIDGASNGFIDTVAVCVRPFRVTVNPLTNMVYVAGTGSDYLSVIDGASNAVIGRSTLLNSARAVAVNPVTNRAYVANTSGNNIIVLDGFNEQATGVHAQWYPAWGSNYTTASQPALTGYAVNSWSPSYTLVHNIATTTGGWGEPWNWGTTPGNSDSVSWTFGWGDDTLKFGENFLSVVPYETQLATTNNFGPGMTFAGNLLCSPLYRLEIVPPATVWWDSLPDDNSAPYGPYTVRARIDDFSNIYRADLWYKYDVLPAFIKIDMARGGRDTFSAVIPGATLAAGDSTRLQYYIHSRDFSHLLNDTVTATRIMKLRNLSGVEGQPETAALPRTFALQPACPNPSRGQTVIKYQLPQACRVKLEVFNVAGQLVKSFNEGQKPAGYHQIGWNDNTLSNGIYLYKLQAGEFIATKKLVVLK